jgi:hypothetical protein
MQNQLAQLQAMQNQIQSPIPNQQQPNGVVQTGMFVVVRNIQDMENYPAPVSGEPVNIFIDGKGVFYSKKMINGSTSCQPFSFAPLNNSPVENETDNTVLSMLGEITERLNKLEANNGEYVKRNKQSDTNSENN